MKIGVLLIFLLSICFAIGIEARVSPKVSEPTFQFPDKHHWAIDKDPDVSITGPEHFYYEGTTDIDLNIMPIIEDFESSIKTRGVDRFVGDLLNGKNIINKMFGVGETRLHSFHLSARSNIQVLEISSHQTIEGDTFQTLERYSFYKGGALHTELRWKNKSDQQKVKQARSAFSQIIVRFPAGATR